MYCIFTLPLTLQLASHANQLFYFSLLFFLAVLACLIKGCS